MDKSERRSTVSDSKKKIIERYKGMNLLSADKLLELLKEAKEIMEGWRNNGDGARKPAV